MGCDVMHRPLAHNLTLICFTTMLITDQLFIFIIVLIYNLWLADDVMRVCSSDWDNLFYLYAMTFIAYIKDLFVNIKHCLLYTSRCV